MPNFQLSLTSLLFAALLSACTEQVEAPAEANNAPSEASSVTASEAAPSGPRTLRGLTMDGKPIKLEQLPPEVRAQLEEAMRQNGLDPANTSFEVGATQAQSVRDLTGQPFPAESLTAIDGQVHALHGQATILTLWASWCTPCLTEMPLFSELAAARPDFRILTLNVDEDASAMQDALAKQPIPFPVVFDQGNSLFKSIAIKSLPLTFVLDEQGIVQHQHVGSVNTLQQLQKALALDTPQG